MKNTSGRIPKSVDSFNSYINNTENYLRANLTPTEAGKPTDENSTTSRLPDEWSKTREETTPLYTFNWQRLGMIASEMELWTNYKNQWNALYQKYSDKEASRTIVITNKLRGVQDDFKLFAQRLLNMMTGIRTVTDDDAAVLNFALYRSQPSRSSKPIEEIPTFSASPLGGEVIKFVCRPTSDSRRSSKQEEASGIEIRYEIGDGTFSTGADKYTFFASTKSIFSLTLPKIAKGKTMFVSARWIVASDHDRNGPWSNVLSVVVA
jgi:hypothetical protein